MNDGFLFDGLSELRKNLMLAAKDKYPKETEKFLKQEAKKIKKNVKSKANKLVGKTKKIKRYTNGGKSYHQSFRIGKIYVYSGGDKNIRVYSSDNVAHLVEYGHWNVPRSITRPTSRMARKIHAKTVKTSGFTAGRYPILLAEIDFQTEFEADAEDFLYQFVDDTINGKL